MTFTILHWSCWRMRFRWDGIKRKTIWGLPTKKDILKPTNVTDEAVETPIPNQST